MKEGLFILAFLIVSSYAIENRHPGGDVHKDANNLKPVVTPITKQSPASHPGMQFRANIVKARLDEAHKARLVQQRLQAATVAHTQTQHHGQTHEQAHVIAQASAAALATVQDGLNVTADNSSSTGVAHVKGTPGAACDVYTTCVECTDDDAKAFYCMWSAARNVCQEDTDMDKLKRANPQDLWTKVCSVHEPDPITTCDGCPILAIDHKPARDILDAKIKGSNGDEVSATEGSLNIIGQDPTDPVTGPILYPNGTNNPQFLLPSIRDDDGNIKDPIQDPEKLVYSACTDGSCAASFRVVSQTTRKGNGKFKPELLTDADLSASTVDSNDQPRMKQEMRAHVDKVAMQDAQLEDPAEDKDDAQPSSALEVSSNVVKDDDAATPAAGGGFTPAFSDDDTSSSSKDETTISTPSSSSPSSSSTTDEPRFTQSKRSEFRGMSSEKAPTQPKDNTMEVTEFDDAVVGGRKINEDEDSKSAPQEADDKQ